MITLLGDGDYSLIETNRQTKILTLDTKKHFAWVDASGIGEILVASSKEHRTDHILATGKYRLYDVVDEAKLTDLMHLELLVGDGVWQGYILPTGFPSRKDKRNRIIPTKELITKSTYLDSMTKFTLKKVKVGDSHDIF